MQCGNRTRIDKDIRAERIGGEVLCIGEQG